MFVDFGLQMLRIDGRLESCRIVKSWRCRLLERREDLVWKLDFNCRFNCDQIFRKYNRDKSDETSTKDGR